MSRVATGRRRWPRTMACAARRSRASRCMRAKAESSPNGSARSTRAIKFPSPDATARPIICSTPIVLFMEEPWIRFSFYAPHCSVLCTAKYYRTKWWSVNTSHKNARSAAGETNHFSQDRCDQPSDQRPILAWIPARLSKLISSPNRANNSRAASAANSRGRAIKSV